MRYITMGKPESTICATCEYWEGPRIQNRGLLHRPQEFILDGEDHISALCMKQHCKRLGRYRCREHQFRYDLLRYL